MSAVPIGEGTGPLHLNAEVLSSKKVGAYRHLVLAAPGVAERFRPGNFVAVSLPGGAQLARRSLWIHKVKPTGSHGPTIELVIEPGASDGSGTAWLAGLTQGSKVDLTGPLGRPFAQPKEPVNCVLVGEGYAAAALFPLAERLRERGCAVTILLAGDDEAHVFGALEARRTARSVSVVTADGSLGAKGTAGQALPGILQRAEADVVYAAGPAATLHAVAAAAEAHGAWSQVALEIPQPCGTGLCHACIVPVIGEDGIAHKVRACAEGPVFRGDRLQWGLL
jgi:dihydroorotate dehydrogenase electron transfer subunit